MKKIFSLLICSMLLSSCSNAKKNTIDEGELDKQIVQTKIMAISSSLETASFVYRAAYKNSEKPSEVNDHLYLYALSEIESLFNTYDMGGIDYKKDITSYRLISGDAIDSMCIINKFFSVHDKFHRTLILSGFCLLKIAKISLNSSFFPKPIKR